MLSLSGAVKTLQSRRPRAETARRKGFDAASEGGDLRDDLRGFAVQVEGSYFDLVS